MKRQSTEIKVEAALTGGINDNTREREGGSGRKSFSLGCGSFCLVGKEWPGSQINTSGNDKEDLRRGRKKRKKWPNQSIGRSSISENRLIVGQMNSKWMENKMATPHSTSDMFRPF